MNIRMNANQENSFALNKLLFLNFYKCKDVWIDLMLTVKKFPLSTGAQGLR
jgi:hypothetical protein